jgi:Predicted membrane protein
VLGLEAYIEGTDNAPATNGIRGLFLSTAITCLRAHGPSGGLPLTGSEDVEECPRGILAKTVSSHRGPGSSRSFDPKRETGPCLPLKAYTERRRHVFGRSDSGKEAAMMPYGWHDGGWGIAWMILSLGVIVALTWAFIRAFASGGDRHEPPRGPEEVLAERFAMGEIDADEYRARRRVLEENRTPTTHR